MGRGHERFHLVCFPLFIWKENISQCLPVSANFLYCLGKTGMSTLKPIIGKEAWDSHCLLRTIMSHPLGLEENPLSL